jgi:hypothetical protein
MQRRLLLVLISLVLPLATTAAKKAGGEVWDAATLPKVHSYCIDSSTLPGYEACDIERLIENEGKPKHLLAKLPWTLVSDCSKSDAVVRVSFRLLRKTIDIQAGETRAEDQDRTFPYECRAGLQVSDEASAQVLYEVETTPLLNSMTGASVAPEEEADRAARYDAAYHGFWALILDLQHIPDKGPK